mmetsp:Transcript_7879/g.15764  ORF Transcript_7879/g.15764 Transcript_7879/m.15764 type:complete len:249 (-) Transcript_7879:306-1052(-)
MWDSLPAHHDPVLISHPLLAIRRRVVYRLPVQIGDGSPRSRYDRGSRACIPKTGLEVVDDQVVLPREKPHSLVPSGTDLLHLHATYLLQCCPNLLHRSVFIAAHSNPNATQVRPNHGVGPVEWYGGRVGYDWLVGVKGVSHSVERGVHHARYGGGKEGNSDQALAVRYSTLHKLPATVQRIHVHRNVRERHDSVATVRICHGNTRYNGTIIGWKYYWRRRWRYPSPVSVHHVHPPLVTLLLGLLRYNP